MNKDTGGPAFPRSESLQYSEYITGGMTLRDYFAAKAMEGLMSVATSPSELASMAYVAADAMLKAREQ